jgi:hypothetical protein
MPTEYAPHVLQQFADQLYREAKWIVVITALRYGVVMLLLAMPALMVLDPRARFAPFDSPNMLLVWLATGAAFLAGLEAGRRKAFRLKLEAQKVLCNLQIERNTRLHHTSASA